jgi:hypothetical protein
MTLEQAILDAVRNLPAEKQEEILDHAKQLRRQSAEPKQPRKSGRGLWADLDIRLTIEDIDAARREMWKNFPRNDF